MSKEFKKLYLKVFKNTDREDETKTYYTLNLPEGLELVYKGKSVEGKIYGNTPISNLESRLERGFIDEEKYEADLERYAKGGDMDFIKIEFNVNNPKYQG